MTDLEHVLRRHLPDHESGWSMGSFGAIAEFHQNQAEVAVIDDSYALTRATRRGAIRLDRRKLPDVTAVAYETLSPKRHRWSHGLALCLDGENARREARGVLTELGPDDHAIRGIDRTGILFDLGLSLPQCDFCIRTSDPKVLAELRSNLGRSLFEPGNTAMHVILAQHPHRVALTNLGRLEVFQKIGGPDTDGISPAGPHTHVLPKLLKAGRTHSANTPIPEGLTPVAFLHPGNPVIGPMGEDRQFQPALHAEFAWLLERYGAPEAVRAKAIVSIALDGGQGPGDMALPSGRFASAAARVALRQMARIAENDGDEALLQWLAPWCRVLDMDPDAEEDDSRGH